MALYEYRNKTANLSDLQEAYHQIETLEKQERMSTEERNRSMIAQFRLKYPASAAVRIFFSSVWRCLVLSCTRCRSV